MLLLSKQSIFFVEKVVFYKLLPMQALYFPQVRTLCYQTFRNIGIGVGVSCIEWIVRNALLSIVNFFTHFKDPFINQEKLKKYHDDTVRYPLNACVFFPILEEVFYRAWALNSYKLLIQDIKLKNIFSIIPNLIANFLFIILHIPYFRKFRFDGLLFLSYLFHHVLSQHSKINRKYFIPANFLQSLLFGVAHLQNFGSLYQTIGSFFSGILYGYLIERYGIVCSISVHMTNNFLSFLILSLPRNDPQKI